MRRRIQTITRFLSDREPLGKACFRSDYARCPEPIARKNLLIYTHMRTPIERIRRKGDFMHIRVITKNEPARAFAVEEILDIVSYILAIVAQINVLIGDIAEKGEAA